MTLIRVGTGDWRVIDATPDGQPMDSAIQIFNSVEQAQQNVTVTADSVFMFAPRWQFNVIVHNTIEGLVSVPSQPSARNRILEIPFALGGKLLKFQFALQGVVNPGPAPVPLPTATALAPAGST